MSEKLPVKYRAHPRRVTALCGHRLETLAPPTTHCEGCWTQFFLDNEKLTKACLEEDSHPWGKKKLREVAGRVFVKHLRRFAEFKAMVKSMSETEKE